MIKKGFVAGVLGIALLTFPILTFAEEVEPPIAPAVEEVAHDPMVATESEPANPEPPEPESPSDDIVTEESCEPVTPSAVEDSSMYGNPSMDENLILTSVVGVPDELRVIFSLDGQEVAVVQGNQILRSEAFPQDQKMFLEIRIEGQGRLMGARFGFEPFAIPVILPELPLEEIPELENPEEVVLEENTKPTEVDLDEPEAPVEDTAETEAPVEDTTEPEAPVEDTTEPGNPADDVVTEPDEDDINTGETETEPEENTDLDTAEPGTTEPTENTGDTSEPTSEPTSGGESTSEPASGGESTSGGESAGDAGTDE